MASDNNPILARDVSKFLNSLKLDNSALPHTRTPGHESRSKAVPVSDIQHVKLPEKLSYKHHASFVLQPNSRWLALPPLESSSTTSAGLQVTSEQVASLIKRAEKLHNDDIKAFQSSLNSSSSEAGFLFKIIHSGTLSDRLSALSLLVQSSPLHNVKALETLKSMAERGKGKGGREESLKALRCIVDWWVGGGSPDRKLKYFRDQQLLDTSVTNQHLLAWYFEDWLKKYFFSVLQILEVLSLDPLPYVRTQAINLIFNLLRDKPEQEQNLLRLLVNKLGDTEKSICSRASYHLLQLLQTHPAMKAIVAREIISIVLKPSAAHTPPSNSNGLPKGTGKHIRFTDNTHSSKLKSKPQPVKKINGNSHARYYSMITLNQIVLIPSDREVARQLLNVYFEVFKEVLGESKDDVDEKSQEDNEPKSVVRDKAGRVIEGGRKDKKGKKEQQRGEVKGAAGFSEVEDANAKLISATLTGVNRALPFAKVDAADGNIGKHIDTLFLITHKSTFNISLQALVLIQQISSLLNSSAASSGSLARNIEDRYYRVLYASLYDTRLANSSKQAMYLNLLFKSMKADAENIDRVVAFVKRFIQVLVCGGSGATEVVAGGLYLLGELFGSVPGLRSTIYRGPEPHEESYDPRKRDPQFAHARSSALWELMPLLHHYHPAVSLHARQLLMSQQITANPDLTENTLSHFLDRFVYKNAKKSKSGEVGAKTKGSSAMQPAASGLDGLGVKIMKAEVDGASMRTDEASFLRKKESEIPADQIFFHRYFTKKNERQQAKAAKNRKRKQGSEKSETEDEAEDLKEDDADDSDLDEKEVWKAMKATIPQGPGDDDEDDDLLEGSEEWLDASMSDGDSEEDDEESKLDGLGLVEGSDDEDLVEGLMEYDGTNSEGEAEEWGGIETEDRGKKRKRGEERKEERKRLRSLPTFASYEEYATIIEDHI